MKNLNTWERLEKNIGKGVLIQYREKTPYEKIMDIGKTIKTREALKKEGAGVPNYTRAEKKKIKKDMLNYLSSMKKEYGK